MDEIGRVVNTYFDVRGKPVTLLDEVGRGGEACVYTIQDRPTQVAKIYEPAPRLSYSEKLVWMVAHPPVNPTRALNHPSLAWPAGLLFDSPRGSRRLVGYYMPFLQKAVPVLDVFNPRRRAKVFPQFDRRYLHRVARNLSASLGALHRSGYVVGDLNESNVLVTQTALVTLIDTDSFQVREERNGQVIVHPCPVAKLEYTPPELQGILLQKVIRQPEHDVFGLAVLIFQLLMEGNHPFRAEWKGAGEPPPLEARISSGSFPYSSSRTQPVAPPSRAPELKLMHPGLVELFYRCFIDGHTDPGRRPKAVDWERSIAEAEQALVTCPNGHIYSDHVRVCPVCGVDTSKAIAWAPKQSVDVRHKHPEVDRPVAEMASQKPSTAATPAPATSSQTQAARPVPNPRPVYTRPQPVQQSSSPAVASAPAPSSPTVRMRTRTWTPQPASRPFTIPTVTFPRTGTYRPGGLRANWWNWMRPRLLKSLYLGAGTGALGGLAFGALANLAGGAAGNEIAWRILWALGGAAGGALLGWQPGHRMAGLIERTVGWYRFWRGLGLVIGAMLGFMLALPAAFAIFPLFVGAGGGAYLGWSAGHRIWLLGLRMGWRRIWSVASGLNAALVGGLFASVVGVSPLGGLTSGWSDSLSAWLLVESSSMALTWFSVGALGGMFGGAISGFLTDAAARITGLVD